MSKNLTSDWGNGLAEDGDTDDIEIRDAMSEPPGFDEPGPGNGRAGGRKPNNHGLPSRNVVIDGKRTSIRLDSGSLECLNEIATRERQSISEICSEVHRRNQGEPYTFTAALRIFMLSYYRAAATKDGHKLAGHGLLPEEEDSVPSAARSDRPGLGRKRPVTHRTGAHPGASGESAPS